MKKYLFTISLLLLTIAASAQGLCVYILDYDGDFTNVRNAPKGKIVFKLPARDGVMIDVDKVVNGWWHICSEYAGSGDENYKLTGSTTGYWIHSSVVATGTRNYGGQKLTLRKEPSDKSAVIYSFTDERNLRVLDIMGDWVKVRTLDGKYTGWIDSEWLCGNSLTNCC